MGLHKWLGGVCLGVALLLAGCGGGGGGGGNDGANSAETTPVAVTPPDLQYNVERAVLKTEVKKIDRELNGPDINGNFVADDISSYQVGDIFIFNKISYKVIGSNPLPGGLSGEVFSIPATLDEVYSDLKFNYTVHPIAYDSNGKVQKIGSNGVLNKLKNLVQNDVPQTTMENPTCLVPKREVTSNINGDEYGIEYEADCSVAELLGVSSDSNDKNWVRIKGKLILEGKSTSYKDISLDTEYIDHKTSGTLDLTAALQTSKIPLADIKSILKSYCDKYHLSRPSVRCEVEDANSELKATLAIGLTKTNGLIPTPAGVPIPYYLSGGVILEITFSASGEATIGGTFSKNIRAGRINGVKILENPKITSSLSKTTGAQLNGELDIFSGLYAAAGIGASDRLSGVEVRLDVGLYAKGTGQFPPPCLKLEIGARTHLDINAFAIGNFEGFTLKDDTYNIPFESWSGTVPKDCESPAGEIKLKYKLDGANYYSYSKDASTDNLDAFLASNYLISDHRISIDLTETRKILDKAIAFDVQVLDHYKNADLLPAFSTLTTPSSTGVYRATIDTGNTSYGDHIKIRVSAYVPGEKDKTLVSRDINVIIDPELSASPKYFRQINIYGIESYEMYLNIGSGVDLSKIKSGYIELDNSYKIPLTQENGTWKTQYGRWLNSPYPSKAKPVQLILFTTLNQVGDGQKFSFIEDTTPSVDKITVTPNPSKIGEKISLSVFGKLLPSILKLETPNCINLIEKRTSENIAAKNWSTTNREFTCEANSQGFDLIAKVSDIDFGFAPYSISSNACPDYQIFANGGCQSLGSLNSTPSDPTLLDTIEVWVTRVWTTVKTIAFNFTDKIVSVVNGATEHLMPIFNTPGDKPIAATFMDSTGAVLGKSSMTITVKDTGTTTVYITSATSDTTTQPGQILTNGTTDDATPTLTGTLNAPIPGKMLNIFDGTERLDPAATVSGTSWTFTPAVPRPAGAHSFTAQVAFADSTPASALSAPYVVNVQSTSVSTINPKVAVRGTSYSFDVAGIGLPTSGLTVTVPNDSRGSCQTPNNMTTLGFNVACQFYKLGAQTLEVRSSSRLLGTVTVTVKSNVTGVTWTTASTTNSGTVKFGEFVVFSVTGTDLLVDKNMGFAVEKCGVSNTEIVDAQTNTKRTFFCTFNDVAGAIAGQMTGVVKDSRDDGTLLGQVLFGGPDSVVAAFKVPVEVPVVAPTSGNLLLGSTVTDSCASCSISTYGNPNMITDGDFVTGRNLGMYSGNFTIIPTGPVNLSRITMTPSMTPSGSVTYEVQTNTDPNGAAGTWTSHGGRLTSTWADKVAVNVPLNANTFGVRAVKIIVYSSPSWVALFEVQGFASAELPFQNDFSTASDLSGWEFNLPWNSTYKTTDYSLSNGYLELSMLTTDKGASVLSPSFSKIGKIKFSTRHFLHPGSSPFLPNIELRDEASAPTNYVANSTINVIHIGFQRSTHSPDYACSAYDVPRIIGGNSCVPKTFASTSTSTSLFDKWITTVVTYDPATGSLEVDYENDGVLDFIGVVPSSDRFTPTRVAFSGFGWFTGHYHRIDSVTVESVNP